jgi:hypothetical protein
MTPFRDDQPAVEAALTRAARRRGEDAKATAESRLRNAVAVGLSVVALLVTVVGCFVMAWMFFGALFGVMGHD